MLAEEIKTTFEIDKSSWFKVKLGDVVREVRETVKDPVAKGIERIVGLEHLEPESLHIKSWGTLNDGTTFTKVFRKGQVLFGRRRAYLKKAALATFDGICSGDITVLEAKKSLLPELLPFLIQNDKFFALAIKNSAGSLSPRAKFADFADYEFLLPPMDQQEQMAELLWAGNEVVERYISTLNSVNKLKYVESVRAFNNGIETNRVDNIQLPNDNWKLSKIKDVIPDIEYGISISIPDNQDPMGIPIISTAEIDTQGNLNYSIIRKVRYERGLTKRLELQTNDLLFNWRNSVELIGKSAIFQQPENDVNRYTFASFILRLRCDEKVAHNYFYKYLLNYYREVGVFIGLARRAVNQANFNKNEVLDLVVPVPPYREQLEIANRLNGIESNKSEVLNTIKAKKALQKSLLNQFF